MTAYIVKGLRLGGWRGSVHYDIGDLVQPYRGEELSVDEEGDTMVSRLSDGKVQFIYAKDLEEIIDVEYSVIEETITQKYILVEPVTLRGEPAGPYEDEYDDSREYLAYKAGDIVTKLTPEEQLSRAWETPEGIVVVEGTSTNEFGDEWEPDVQELDESSLRRVWEDINDVPDDVVVKDGYSYWRFKDGVRFLDQNFGQEDLSLVDLLWDEGEDVTTDTNDFLKGDGPWIEVTE